MRIAAWTLISVSGLLCSCVGALVPIQTPEMTSARVTDAALNIRILAREQARSMVELGEVEGYSCKNKLWDPAATPEAATHQVKLGAAQRGGTAITALICTEGGFSLTTNCWQSYLCKAIVLR